MPDITMCEDADCPARNDCWRFCAVPSERQSYFMTTPRTGRKQSCEWFYPFRSTKGYTAQEVRENV